MCRLLASISITPSSLYRWVYEASYPLVDIARPGYRGESYRGHPDGWGLGWYFGGGCFLVKEPIAIFESPYAESVIREARSNILLLHVRHATEDIPRVYVNTHPFRYRSFLFIHNGELNRDSISLLMERDMVEGLSGSTDSEAFFHFLLSNIFGEGDVLRGLVSGLRALVGLGDGLKETELTPSLNFVMSEGSRLYAFKWRLSKDDRRFTLFYRRYGDGFVVSSEPLTDDGWESFDDGELNVFGFEGDRVVMRSIRI
jgi:glutamine amidotransferase